MCELHNTSDLNNQDLTCVACSVKTVLGILISFEKAWEIKLFYLPSFSLPPPFLFLSLFTKLNPIQAASTSFLEFCYSCGFLSLLTVLLEVNLGHTLHLLLNKSSGTCGNIFTPVISTCPSALGVTNSLSYLCHHPTPALLQHHGHWYLSEREAGNMNI